MGLIAPKMGRTAHAASVEGLDNRPVIMGVAGEETSVRWQIEALLGAPSSGAGAPTLERVEETLTEGYAEALALDAERLRLERRLSEVAREGSHSGPELEALGKRLTSADGELTRLRALLGSLHDRARALRRTS
jgi:hypothetical protein